MNKSINQKFKQNILIISVFITVIFLVINIALYVINNNYLVNKVQEENRAFLDILTHIINENEVPVALEYVEHYTHIHEVNIEIVDIDGEMIFSSNISHKYTTRYEIETLKGSYTVFMDNTGSVTVNRIELNTLYVNVSLLITYIVAVFTLFKINRQNANQINSDIQSILDLMDRENVDNTNFNYDEFREIFSSVAIYLENIDMLNEQKQMNMRGLAHDIKTPLTIIYSYFERVQKNELVNDEERKIAFESSKRVNELLNDLIENKEQTKKTKINLSLVIKEKLNEFSSVFDSKNISIEQEIENKIEIDWNIKDLSRVIDNIVSNAYYYSREDSKFKVRLRREQNTVIEFISTPTSIEDINTNTLFMKGYRGKNGASQYSYGKGYGLYLCKILLSSINGNIQVEIEEKDVKFTITL